MAVAGGPNTVEDGLVFFYDTGNGKSYKGEPTVNLFTNPTFTGTSGTQTSTVPKNWSFSGDSTSAGFNFYNNTTSPIPLKFPNEGAVITTGTTASNRRIYFRGPVEPSTTYTISYWVYSSTSSSESTFFFTYDSGSNHINSDPYIFSSALTVGEWTYVEVSYTTPSNTDNTRYTNWGPVIAGSNNTLIAIQRFQVEAKSHATPFVDGTRSATEGLKDLTRNSSIDLTNVSFDSNAQIDFDGSNDYIQLNPFGLDVSNGLSYEVVYSAESTYNTWGTYRYLLKFVGTTHYGLLHEGDSRGWRFDVPTDAGVRTGVTTNTPAATAGAGYYHVAVSFDPVSGGKGYLNGVEIGSWAGGYTAFTPSQLLIGSQGGGRYWDGEIPVVKVYNRALTSSEVLQNYNATKGRFGL